MKNLNSPPYPVCKVPFTVAYTLLTCSKYNSIRPSLSLSSSLTGALSDLPRLFSFLLNLNLSAVLLGVVSKI